MAKPRMRGQKTRYHHGDLKQALMDAAATLLDIRGRDALTLREAARRAGVSEAAPYRHFENLDALLGAIAVESLDMLLEDVDAVGGAARKKRAYLDFAQDFPGRYELMFSRLDDKASFEDRANAVAHLAEMLEGAGGLAALHGEASLMLAGFEDF